MNVMRANLALGFVNALLSVSLVVVMLGCPPAPTPLPPDASDAAPPAPAPAPTLPSPWPNMGDAAADGGDLADQVCAHLGAIGCPQLSSCATTIRTKQGTFTDFKPACLLAATSASAANACGTVHCPVSAGAKK